MPKNESVGAVFKGAPRHFVNATRYDQFKEMERLVQHAEEELKAFDGTTSDLNPKDDFIAVSGVEIRDPEVDFLGARVGAEVTNMDGVMAKDGSFTEVSFNTESGRKVLLKKQDSRMTTRWTLDPGDALLEDVGVYRVPPFKSMNVTLNKASGALSITKVKAPSNSLIDMLREERALLSGRGSGRPLDFDRGRPRATRQYGPEGPSNLEEVKSYKRDLQYIEQIEAKIEDIRNEDNGHRDLNPDEGVVVSARMGREKYLIYHEETGAAQQAGDSTFSYQRSDDTEVYHHAAKVKLTQRRDGSLLVEEFR